MFNTILRFIQPSKRYFIVSENQFDLRKYQSFPCTLQEDAPSFFKNPLPQLASYIPILSYQIKRNMQIEVEESFKVDNFLDLSQFAHREIFAGATYPWEVLPKIGSYCSQYIQLNPQANKEGITITGSVHIAQDVIIGEDTVIQHGAMIKGPTIIGKNCEIRKGAYFRGNVIIGDNCVIGNSTQLKNCVVLNKAQICHFNYVGDSVLGEGAHFAAGAITSNLKLDQKQVVVHSSNGNLPTGLQKFGAIVGDYSEVGCNVVLNPGTILGRKSLIYPGAAIRGVIPANHIVKLQQKQTIVMKK